MTAMPPIAMPTVPSKSALATPAAATSLHHPFSWLADVDKDSTTANSNADAMDAFRGIATCLELVEMSNLDRGMSGAADDERIVPVLSMADTGKLMRLAILVAREWGDKFEDRMQNGSAQ